MYSSKFILYCGLLLVLFACQTGTPASDTPAAETPGVEAITTSLEADQAALNELISGYIFALNQVDAEAAVTMFAPDGTLYPNDGQPVSGAEIKPWFERQMAGRNPNVENTYDLEVREMEVGPKIAYATTFNTITAVAEGETSLFHSKSFFLFQRQADGAWKVNTYGFDTVQPEDAQ